MTDATRDSAPLPWVAQQACEIYRAQFALPAAERLAIAWAPGRINLIGEHTDYNEGFVLPAAIDRLVALAGRPADEPFATLYSAHHQAWTRIPLGRDAADVLEDAAIPLWARYIQATWRELALASATPPALGFSAVLLGDVPLGGGLSSSAALEVATALFARALGGPTLPPMLVAQLCQQAEQAGADVRVGIMDQAASCLALDGHAILLDCRTLEYSYITAALPEMAWLVFDTGVRHSLAASSEYNTRRDECEQAVARLAATLEAETAGRHVRALRDVTRDDLSRHGSLLDEILLRRARHVVSENERTLRAAEALRMGEAAMLGALMSASHVSLRDDYAVSCAELDAAVEIAQTAAGTLGARMIGAGFGGSMLALVRCDALAGVQARLATDYPLRTGKIGAVLVCAIAGQTGVRSAFQRA